MSCSAWLALSSLYHRCIIYHWCIMHDASTSRLAHRLLHHTYINKSCCAWLAALSLCHLSSVCSTIPISSILYHRSIMYHRCMMHHASSCTVSCTVCVALVLARPERFGQGYVAHKCVLCPSLSSHNCLLCLTLVTLISHDCRLSR